MLSPIKSLFAVATLLFGGAAAFANSTSFNGYIQTSGNNGLDFNNLSGGTFRITITSTGQINYRYQVGDQVFDSNPEANIRDLIGNRASQSHGSAAGAESAYTPIERPKPMGFGDFPILTYLLMPDVRMRSANTAHDAPNTAGTPNTDDGGRYQPYEAVYSSAPIFFDNNVNASSLVPVAFYVPTTSAVALATENRPVYFYVDSPFFNPGQEVPEPGTFALLGGAMLLGAMGMSFARRKKTPA